jgi:hypothetical protein
LLYPIIVFIFFNPLFHTASIFVPAVTFYLSYSSYLFFTSEYLKDIHTFFCFLFPSFIHSPLPFFISFIEYILNFSDLSRFLASYSIYGRR